MSPPLHSMFVGCFPMNFLKWDNYLSAVKEIKDKNLTVDELGNAFLKSIEKALSETRYDDFDLKETDIKKINIHFNVGNIIFIIA